MALVRGRKANASSIGAAIVLMLSIAVFAGALFYLMINPGMSLAFDVDDSNPLNLGGGQKIKSGQPQWVVGPWSLNQSIHDLRANGCVVTEQQMDEQVLKNAVYMEYESFRTLAMRYRLVVLHHGDETSSLLIHTNEKYYAWKPRDS